MLVQESTDAVALSDLLTTRVLSSVASIDLDHVLDGRSLATRQATRRKFPIVDFYGDEVMPSGLLGHRHRHGELAVATEGQFHVGIGDQLYLAGPGDWLVFQPKVVHGECALPARKPYRLLWLILTADRLFRLHTTAFHPDEGYVVRRVGILPGLPDDLRAEWDHLTLEPWANLSVTRRRLVRLIAWSLDQLRTPNHASGAHPMVEQVRRIVAGSLDHPPTVVELANQVGLSPNYLSNLFHRVTGNTLSRYVDRLRIDEACRRFEDPKQSVKEVAFALGFADQHHFSRVFRRVKGRTPSQYRRESGTPTRE